jgi:NAD(P)-dependent dehydrogenase (short-subunit alcohol dehydrogenase family)
MDIPGSVVLVTGANRGIGAEFVDQLKARGAAKIYAAARDPKSIVTDGVEALALDVTDPARIAAAAHMASDVTLVINNAGSSAGQNLIDGDLDLIRSEFETNVFGPMSIARSFAPVLEANGGGAILNVLSALSWFVYAGATSYCVSKAAAWSATDALRVELSGQGTQVVALHMGAVDTDMTAGWDIERISPAEVVSAALDGIEAGALEVLVDDAARQAKGSLTLDPSKRYAALAASVSPAADARSSDRRGHRRAPGADSRGSDGRDAAPPRARSTPQPPRDPTAVRHHRGRDGDHLGRPGADHSGSRPGRPPGSGRGSPSSGGALGAVPRTGISNGRGRTTSAAAEPASAARARSGRP